MKRYSSRIVLILVGFLFIPTLFNACRGGFLGIGSAFASKRTCKATLFNGQVQKTIIDHSVPPEVFSFSKVKLRDDSASSSFQAQSIGSVPVPAGSKLGVLVSNECLQAQSMPLSETLQSVVAASEAISGLDRQTYAWEPTRDYTDLEIEDLMSREPCVFGVSWNREYRLQAALSDFRDPQITEQVKYLNAIRSIESHDFFYNSGPGMEISGTLANAVKIAVIDTGVDYSHPDLLNSMWSNQNGAGIDITTWGSAGGVNYNPMDISSIGHGTHVAGLIAAQANNNIGIRGVMPYRAKIMAIKIFALNSSGELTTSSTHFSNAVRFAVDNGAHVINLSLGRITAGSDTDALAQSAVMDAVNRKAVVITVIGNADGSNPGAEVNGSTLSSIPGQYSTTEGVIGVGSLDAETGAKSSFSHYSTTYAEIGAPGAERSSVGVFSTKPTGGGYYGRLSGTSQAAPIVSAAAGLAIGIIKEAYNGVAPDPREVESLLLTSAAKSSQLNSYFKNGNRLDLVNLATVIQQRYPLTRTGGGSNIQGCP